MENLNTSYYTPWSTSNGGEAVPGLFEFEMGPFGLDATATLPFANATNRTPPVSPIKQRTTETKRCAFVRSQLESIPDRRFNSIRQASYYVIKLAGIQANQNALYQHARRCEACRPLMESRINGESSTATPEQSEIDLALARNAMKPPSEESNSKGKKAPCATIQNTLKQIAAAGVSSRQELLEKAEVAIVSAGFAYRPRSLAAHVSATCDACKKAAKSVMQHVYESSQATLQRHDATMCSRIVQIVPTIADIKRPSMGALATATHARLVFMNVACNSRESLFRHLQTHKKSCSCREVALARLEQIKSQLTEDGETQ